jgi:hypothetical protein
LIAATSVTLTEDEVKAIEDVGCQIRERKYWKKELEEFDRLWKISHGIL